MASRSVAGASAAQQQPPSARRAATIIYLLLGLAILLGGHLRILAIEEMEVVAPVRADARDYVTYAHNLAVHGVYSRDGTLGGSETSAEGLSPDAVRAPGYPLVLTLFLDNPPTIHDIKQIKWFQAAIGVATIGLAFLLAVGLMPKAWALVPTFLVAISSHLVSHTVYLLTETLFTAVLMAFAVVIVHVERFRSAAVAGLIAGCLLGASALIRPTTNYLVLAYLLAAFLPFVFYSRRLAVMMLLGFCIVFSPWTARNMATLGEPTSSHLKINALHHGMYPGFMYEGDAATYGFPYKADPRSGEVSESVGTILAEIGRRFQAEPWRHGRWFFVGKPLTLWQWGIINGAGDIYTYPVTESPYAKPGLASLTRATMVALHWPTVALALVVSVGVWLPAARRWLTRTELLAIRAISLIILYYIAVHIVGAPFPRYSIPLRPIQYALATWAAVFSWRVIAAYRRGPVEDAQPAQRDDAQPTVTRGA
jgi:hypothetical protein